MKTYKPTSKSRRQMSHVTFRGVITAKEPLKSLTKGYKRDYGRNSFGRVTSQHKGGGHKRLYRIVDFKYDKAGIPAKIASVEYDPNRSAFIGLAVYKDGEKRYVVLPKSVTVGNEFIISNEAPVKPANRMQLKYIPVGTFVYNIELKPGSGAKLVRSAGSYAQVVANDDGYTSLKMPSTEIRKVLETCQACIGSVSNEEYNLQNYGKAGRSRWMGIRPKVRGTAMNPVDHPHGGGEGRQGIGLRRGPKTRHGKQAYGVKTRTPKKYSNHLVVSRRKTKR